MIARTLIAAFMASSAFAYNSTTNGVSGSFDINILSQAKDVYFEKLITLINEIEIPDMQQDKHDYIKQNSLVIN